MIDFMQSNAVTIILILFGFIFAMPLLLDLISEIAWKFRGKGKTPEQIIKDLKEYADWLEELNIIIEEPEDKPKPKSTKKP